MAERETRALMRQMAAQIAQLSARVRQLEELERVQYAMLAGRSGGQTLQGGTGAGDDLTLESTSHATKGEVYLQPNGGYVVVGGDGPSFTEEGNVTNGYLFVARGDAALRRGAVYYYEGDSALRNAQNAFLRARASLAAVQDDDTIGDFFWSGHDGVDFNRSAAMLARVKGSVSGNTVPLEWVVQTSATNSGGLADRLLVAPDGVTTLTKHLERDDFVFCAYDSAGGTNVTAGAAIPLGTEIRKDAQYTHSTSTNPAQVTFDEAGDYLIRYDISIYITSGTSRSVCRTELQVDTGGGFAQLAGSLGYTYNRQATAGENTASCAIVYTASAGDKVQMYADQISGTDTTVTVAGGSRLTIERI